MSKVNVKDFRILINCAYLGGIINEVILSVENGIGKIQAIDSSNCLLVNCQQPLGIKKDMVLGLPNLALLSRGLSGEAGEYIKYSIAKNDKFIKLSYTSREGNICLQLQDLETITSAIEDPVSVDNLLKKCPHKVALTKQKISDFLYFINLFGSNFIHYSVNENDFFIGNDPLESDKFSLKLAAKCGYEDMEVLVYGDHLKAIFSAVPVETDEDFRLYFGGSDLPVIIRYKENYVWALSPHKNDF